MSCKSKVHQYGLFLFLCSLFIGLSLNQLVGQQQYKFQSFQKKEGLSNNSIRKVLQDRDGFIWVATDNGLNRFDGKNFLSFRFDPTNPNSINSNKIAGLAFDSKEQLWIGTDSGLCRLDLNSGVIKRYDFHELDSSYGTFQVRSLLIDQNGNIWVGTLTRGLFKLSPVAKGDIDEYQIKQYRPNPQVNNSLTYPNVEGLQEDDHGHIWIGSNGGIDRLHIQTETFVHLADLYSTINPAGIDYMIKDRKGNILFPIRPEGIFYIDPKAGNPQIQPYFQLDFQIPDVSPIIYTSILEDHNGQFWVGTDYGILLVDSTKTAYTHLPYDAKRLGTISTPGIRCFEQSQDGVIWVGTNNGGLNRESRSTNNYWFYQHEKQDPSSIANGQVRTIAEDQQNNLWVGFLGAGVEQFRWDQSQQKLVKLQHLQYNPSKRNTLSGNDIIEIFTDSKGFLWIGTNGTGLNKLDPQTGKIQTFVHDPKNPATLSGNKIWGIGEDHNGYIWVGDFLTGLNRLDPVTGLVKRFSHEPNNPNSLSHNRVKSLMVDFKGHLWIGTNGGLNKLEVDSETFTRYTHDFQDSMSLSNNLVFAIYEDIFQNLWVGTALGLNKLKSSDRDIAESFTPFERLYEANGLPSSTIYGIEGDLLGNLWISTDNGLAQSLAAEENTSFQIIDDKDRLRYAFHPPKAHYFSKKNKHFYFGTRDGLVLIPTYQDKPKQFDAKMLLNAVSKYSYEGEDRNFSVDWFVEAKEEWQLTHNDRVVTFMISELNWDKTSSYEYLLKGFDAKWRELPENMEITYTNLAAGRYNLLARKRGPEEQFIGETQLLQIRVFPPWWKTNWAYMCYLLGMGSIIFSLYRFQLRQQLKKQETENLRALDHFKNKLYTNITHEFRTPLTVISGMIEQVSGHDQVKKIIKRNSKSLLNLVNQILDLRKMELGKLKTEWVQVDVVLYFQYILESYEALAALQDIDLHFIPQEKELLMDIDEEKLLRILSNLLSNAIKFTPAGGSIYLGLEKSSFSAATKEVTPMLKFFVKDTGTGIAPAQQGFIFDRFYQVAENKSQKKGGTGSGYQYRGPGGGSGIGLALTKDLVHLLEGKIDLDSQSGEGTTFTIWLPIRQTASQHPIEPLNIPAPILSADDLEQFDKKLTGERSGQNDSSLQLLVVEDNADVRHYLETLLQEHYQLFIAKDGQEGVEKAFELIPDIIISDVMMPNKDGFELCSELKADFRTSHIPIVLLTAKSSVESRVEGYRQGADAYLSKPFNQEELFVRVEKLLELRQGLRDRYLNFSEVTDETLEKDNAFALEDEFILELKAIVESNMQRSTFAVPELCRAMGVSRSLLHRKLKALTNKSTTHFIRMVRLYKAKALLEDKTLNITEVAFEVGFSDISYFSKRFTEEFGLSPTSFRKTFESK